MSYILNSQHLQDKFASWEELAVLDESADYEVDVTEIHYDTAKKDFILLTASGCSCWDGEFQEEHYSTLDDMESSLFKDERKYNASFVGAKSLVKEAKEIYEKKYRPEYIEVDGVYTKVKY